MKKRIIVYGVNYYPPKGGTSTVAENLVLQLKMDYDITVYCYKNKFAKNHISGVKTEEFGRFASGSLGSLIYFFLSAVHILLFGKADIVHAHKTDCALFIPLIRLRFKVVATSHEAPYKRDKWNFIQKAYFRMAESIFIKSASLCTCISEPLSKYYEGRYKRKVYFIPNGINITEKNNLDFQAIATFVSKGASIDQPFILFSTRRLMATKGCHTLLEALHQMNYDGQVFITGELEETSYLLKLRSLSIGLNVFFLGYVEPLSALLALVSRARLFIFPSETEGMSIMLLEAASVGAPIIASDISENKQVFPGEEVMYFECGNAGDLANKLAFALSEPAFMNELGLKAQKLVLSHYLWAEVARSYDQIFKIVENTSL